MNNLLPCPFCGCEAELTEHKSLYLRTMYVVACKSCGDECSKQADTPEAACTAWNNRVPIKKAPRKRRTGYRKHDTIEGAFWEYVSKSEPDECWEWKGIRDKDGYGAIKFQYRRYRAHRVSYELHHGDLPDGMYVCHTCDNPACVNPAHLFAGTNRDNVDDMKGKQRQTIGERNAAAKLTSSQIQEIRRLYRRGVVQTNLAARFGVRQTTISRIVRGESWTHI